MRYLVISSLAIGWDAYYHSDMTSCTQSLITSPCQEPCGSNTAATYGAFKLRNHLSNAQRVATGETGKRLQL
jgi:hypothetical protein